MAEQDSAPGTWGHHNLKTAADVRRMLRGEAAPTISEGELLPPTPALPPAAVTATVETVDEQPLKTVEIIAPAVPKRSHSKKVS